MREILFRGQTRRKGEKVRMDGSLVEGNWVYGGIFPNNKGGDFAIIYQQEPEIKKCPVYSDTVGQYTRAKDFHKEQIFEDDIVKAIDDGYIGVVKYGHHPAFKLPDACDGNVGFYIDWQAQRNLRRSLLYWADKVEVIGNVHDNPELLKGGEPG